MLEINPQTLLERIDDLAWLSDDVIQALSQKAKLVLYKPREIVFQGDQNSDYVYLLISGEVQIISMENNKEHFEGNLYEFDLFGINFIFDKALKNEQIFMATSQSLLLQIPTSSFKEAIQNCTSTKGYYELLSHHYDAYSFIKRSTSLGDQLAPLFLIEFVSAFEIRTYNDNEKVFAQGDEPDGYYICNEGRLKVIVTVNGNVVFTGDIQEGDYFGELALTTNSKRSGTIESVGESQCFFLSRKSFDDLVKKEPQLLKGFELLAKLAY